MEIAFGILGLLLLPLLWDEGPFRWLILGMSVLSLSPWPGAAVLVRRAEAQPERFIPPTDPAELARRRRRAYVLTTVFMVVGAIPAIYLGFKLD